jgi:hypothetical protein
MSILYDPRYQTFEDWACLLCEQYAAQNLSIPNAGTDWKQWAEGLKAIDIFTNEGVPGPMPFNNWQDWALAFVNAVNAGR